MLMQMNSQDHAAGSDGRTVLTNARVVLSDRIVDGDVVIENGRIASVGTGSEQGNAIDFGGDYLIPGLVDIHTDHFEKHVYPRSHVRWDFMRAALAHDAQIIGGGVTTVFDSLCVGATTDNPERAQILKPMIDALEKAQGAGMLRAEHLVHLRCEITDEETPALLAANIERPIVKMMSVMEHLPGIRQSRDMDAYVHRASKSTGESHQVVRRKIEILLAEKSHIGATVRPKVVALARAHGMPLLSHDDTDIEHVDLAADEGVTISEFPCTLEAALEARRRGMLTVGGAPNVVRGGSQSGNIAVRDLLLQNLIDIMASDYVPRSMLDAAFMIADDPELDFDLPAALRMVTKTPAEAAGLSDRGEIAVGKRADLVRIGLHDGHPYPKQIWREGIRVS
ncbi:alpha-D-ribose 1-methylphosphonate 5-triphosphate diphosphatase [Ciceribacter sp. L1K22]|uniref:alpha-D-ribose 1-methylphosphonate 5-triphosphate diphosphatase n=1 Tax=Ciceribacter sp. L1K22 TaxID=2820275 RepID=UPI001ABECAED|nr:alpha-D-ribose 1-methylphosphonate 5-triphosphate diphosphatase [Ciceribacter sp. L1K22]MBO3762122.1 alpha-D-ribose 1-methylphosphonate 5-triphosphate diphosphatase [Ciceribacter sp. L1K22]